MIEIDVWLTKDLIPVVFHGNLNGGIMINKNQLNNESDETNFRVLNKND
jgi:glycerophosphoryl diester phosphodiesterase